MDRPGRAWLWNVEGIVKAKIVAILRYCKNWQQKEIAVRATGLMPNTPSITEDNVDQLIRTGNLEALYDVHT